MRRTEKPDRIIIASVLKPVDDTRMFEKIAVTLASHGDLEVHVIGSRSALPPTDQRISFYALPSFKRFGIERLLSRLRVLRIVFQLKPAIFIATTHELLGVAVFARIFLGTKVIYDVQENYWRNLVYGKTLPWGVSHLAATAIRLKEIVSALFIQHFILAETCYAKELNFIGRRYTIIENKARKPSTTREVLGGKRNLLFSGTLAESTGVFRAIDIASRLHALDPKFTLTIIGYAADSKVFSRIIQAIAGKPYITLIGGNELVPHTIILQHIDQADFGIICYVPNKATAGKMPTKLYEYLAHRLPFLLCPHKPSEGLAAKSKAAVVLPDNEVGFEKLIARMDATPFYEGSAPAPSWEDQEPALIKAVAG